MVNRQEQKRQIVLAQINRGEASVAQAAELLRLSVRQVQRLHATYCTEGMAALTHGNLGRTPSNALDPAIREEVIRLVQSRYVGINHQHLSELLAERDGIHVSYSTLKRILTTAGLTSPRTRRGQTHRSRRARYAQAGMLVQMDGSPHAWLEQRGPRLCLVAAIDDATGEVPTALFRVQEDAQGYMLLVQQMVMARGRPLAVYHDRHGIFTRAKTEQQTLEEDLAGRRSPTQVERMLDELAITSIAARSPQAKGRVERLFGTLQDRLVTELHLAEICTQDAATAFLPGFLTRFNRQFGIPEAEEGSTYRPLDATMQPDTIFCFKYLRTVGSDNVARFLHHRLQLTPCHGGMNYAKAQVEVHERLDGSLAVWHQGLCLATTDARLEAPVLRARGGHRGLDQPIAMSQSS